MNLARRVFTVSGWTFISRILGLVRDRLFAGAFGASPTLDAFLMAFQLPNLLRNLFGEGALSAAFVPRYVQLRDKDPAAAESFAGRVLARLALGLSLFCAVAMAIAAACIVLAPPAAALVAQLALPQLPFLIFICVAAIMGGMLNGRRRFWVPAAAPVVLNLCLIATVWMQAEDEVHVLPYAVLVAGFSQLVLHLWGLARSGGVPPFSLQGGEDVRELRRAMAPVVLATGLHQINAFLDTVIAYVCLRDEAAGAVAILYFGNRLLQFPMALIAHGVGTAAYPELASRAALGWSATGEGLRVAARLLAFFLMPAAVGLLVVAEPLVRAIYQTGSFTGDAVGRTVLVTSFYALALVPMSLAKLQVRAFHVHRDQATPVRVSIAMVALNLGLNLVLVNTALREAGLALASAISATVGCLTYAVLLRRRGAGATVDLRLMIRPALAAAAMGAVVWALLWWWPQPEGAGSLVAAGRLGVAVVVGALVYLPIAGVGWMKRRGGAAERVDE